MRRPVVNYTLIALNVLVFLGELSLGSHLDGFIRTFGFIPGRFLHQLWQGSFLVMFLPMFTSMFLHGGWFHLIGNMWTLYIFGDNVEDTLGPRLFLVLYFICGVAACLAQFLTGPTSTMPMVGASGAIAGVMGAYFALFPWARVLTLLPLFPFFPIIEVPAYIFLGFWFLLQFFSGTLSILGPGMKGGIAFFAHMGGFAMGYLLLRVFFPHMTGAFARRHFRI
ncbi:MAG: rhomboid family intramembrane serine protease [Thermodesulfobacteriota bacterium]